MADFKTSVSVSAIAYLSKLRIVVMLGSVCQ